MTYGWSRFPLHNTLLPTRENVHSLPGPQPNLIHVGIFDSFLPLPAMGKKGYNYTNGDVTYLPNGCESSYVEIFASLDPESLSVLKTLRISSGSLTYWKDATLAAEKTLISSW